MLEQFHQEALAGRVQVLDDHKCHAAAFGHVGEEQFQRLQSARRGADADDGKEAARLVCHLHRWGGRFFCHWLAALGVRRAGLVGLFMVLSPWMSFCSYL